MSKVIAPTGDDPSASFRDVPVAASRGFSLGLPGQAPISTYLRVLILAIALPFSGLIGYSIWRSFDDARVEQLLAAQRRAEVVAVDIGRFVADSRTTLEQLARRERIRQGSPEDCDPILADFKTLVPQMANIGLADRDGAVVCSALARRSGASVANADWFQAVRRQNRFLAGEPHVGPVSGKWVAVLAQPIADAAGRFNGVVGFPIDLLQFQPLPLQRVAAFGADVTLVSSRGTVMARSRDIERLIGTAYPAAQALPPADTSAGSLRNPAAPDQVVGFANVEGTDWRVIVEVDGQPGMEALRRNARRELLVAAIVILGGLGLAWRVGQYITRPVRDIADAARRVAGGNFGERVSVHGPAEIEAVSRQFNAMLDIRLKAEQKYRSLLESASDAIVVCNRTGEIVLVNRQAEATFGYSREELVGRPVETLLPEELVERHRRHVETFCAYPERREMGRILRARRRDGSTFPVDVGLTPLDMDDGLLVCAMVRDLSERYQYEERLAYLSQYDSLTELPNRLLLRDRLTQAIGRCERAGTQLAVINLDIDRFKELNDVYGTGLADRVLRHCAQQIRECIRDSDTVARTGSDEFIVIVEDIPRDSVAQLFGERLKARLAEGIAWEDRSLPLTASIGIAMHPHDGRDTETLLKSSDLALAQARAEGGGALSFFEDELNARAAERRDILSHLYTALERGELALHYQPQVDTRSGRVVGVEALLRWHSPELGNVSPARFIPLAEESGLIEKIGDWVLGTACAQASAWQRQGLPPLVMAVNLSARQFRSDRLEARVRRILDETGLPASQLELEITEGMLMQDPQRAASMLARLYELGVRIAIDDFGTGYSSLSYLKRFKVSTLKVDQSFVRDISSDPDDAAIVRAVVSLAQSLRLSVTAEGVETESQRLYLEGLGCDHCQGYLFWRPLPPEEIEALLAAAPRPIADISA